MYRTRLFILFTLGVALLVAACSSPTPATPAAPVQQPASTTAPAATATTAPTNTPPPSPTPQPTDTPAPAEGAACLVGAAWQLTDMSDYFTSVMADTGGAATFVGQDGTITYIFGNDGVASVEAENFRMTLQVGAQGVSLDIVVSVDGQATTHFTLSEPNQITFSDPQMGDLKFSATLNGTELFSTTPDEMAAMFGVSPDQTSDTVTYECSGDTMKYTPPVENATPLTFKRVP